MAMNGVEVLRGDGSRGRSWQHVLIWMLAIGLFIQLSGKVWIQSGSARNAQVYIWLLLPALFFVFYKLIVRSKCVPSAHYIPWIFFLLWVGLSALWATGSEKDAFSLAKRGLLIALYLQAIYLLMSYNEAFLKKALFAGVVMVAVGALVSIVYQFGILDKPLAYRAYRIDRSGIGNFANYGWPVVAGIFHGAIAVWALGVALDKRTVFKSVLFWLAIFMLLSLYVLLTYTRGAWFALLGGIVAVVILQNSRLGWWLLGIGTVLVLALVIKFWPQLVIEFQEKQLSGRGPIWVYYFKIMSGHWAVGHGLGTPFEYRWPDGVHVSPHAHSLYLQQVYDSGIVSLALLGAGLLGLAHKAWKLRSNYWVRLAFPALVFALIAMLTDVERIFTRPGDYWTLFWLPVAILLAVPMRSKDADQATDSN